MTYDLLEVVKLFGIGYASGIILSVLPLVVGEIINLMFKIMKGGK